MAEANWTPLTHSLFRWCKAQGLTESRLGLAVSGGKDSVLLAQVLAEVAGPLKLHVEVLHCHHGSGSVEQENYREHSLKFCRQLGHSLRFGFNAQRAEQILTSESEMRDFRRRCFIEWQSTLDLRAILVAHHAQDLLETRLLRLIRGTGGQGLKSMSEDSGLLLRPWLMVSVEVLNQEAKMRELEFIEDPSNLDSRYLRNWLRNDWLPKLEAHRPGSVMSLAQSLELIVQELDSAQKEFPPAGLFIEPSVLAQAVYLQLSAVDQKRGLAKLIQNIKGLDYSSAQIEEIQKRLDKSQNEHSFKVAGLQWTVTKHKIQASSDT